MPGSGSPTSEDDLGDAVAVPRRVERVVSLVPSLTEAVAATAPGLLVGATDWCTHPADLDVVRVRGTKNPRLETVVALRPDVVLANAEENRLGDVAALRAQGVAVWVTGPVTVEGALGSLDRMLRLACRVDRPPWLDQAAAVWTEDAREPAPVRARVLVPVWRRPWLAVGAGTFAGDVLRHLGFSNALGGSPERYPRIDLAALPPHDLVVLPDEPYRFTATDGPECFAAPSRLVSGRYLTWYGPSLVAAREVLTAQLGQW